MYIDNIESGNVNLISSDNYYRSNILYADVRDDDGKSVCSGTLDYIILNYADKGVTNYKEILKLYVEWNEKLHHRFVEQKEAILNEVIERLNVEREKLFISPPDELTGLAGSNKARNGFNASINCIVKMKLELFKK